MASGPIGVLASDGDEVVGWGGQPWRERPDGDQQDRRTDPRGVVGPRLGGALIGFDDRASWEAMAWIAAPVERRDARTRNLWFRRRVRRRREIAPAVAVEVVKRLRQVGLERVLWLAQTLRRVGNLPPDEWWASVSRLPLTRAEIARIGSNAVPSWSDRLGRRCDAPPPRWPWEVGVVHPYESVEFPSEGAVLRGRLYRAAEASRPAVVMTHGTSATITMAIDAYAEAIFAAGCTVVDFLRRVLG